MKSSSPRHAGRFCRNRPVVPDLNTATAPPSLPRAGSLPRSFAFVLAGFAVVISSVAAAPVPPPDSLDEAPEAFSHRLQWWRDAAFGLFIHWGPSAVPAGRYHGAPVKGLAEWIMDKGAIPVAEYEDFARQFNPTAYDADAWARAARDAGVRYLIVTAKHHDGFCLWDSAVSSYDAVDFAPIHRDLLGELKAACDRAGVRFGIYYSIMDWHHPDAQAPHYPDYNSKKKTNPNFDRYVADYLKPQLRELIENYDPAVLWFDGEWIPEWTHEQGLDLYGYVRGLKPDLIVNNRVDKGRQGMKGMNRDDRSYAGDFGTPEQEILGGHTTLDWETCMTMNDSWGFKAGDENWKPVATLLRQLIEAAAKGGNYLLNIGPTAEGTIPPPSLERLAEMGAWLRVNGEAIYATTAQPRFKEDETVFFTRHADGSTLYAILTAWPGEELRLTQIAPDDGAEINLLGYDQPLPWHREGDTTVIRMPDATPVSGQYAWVLRLRGRAASD